VESRLSVAGIMALTIITCVLAVAAAIAPAIWSARRGEAAALAAEASVLAECGLERALCEILETGECRSADRAVHCGGNGEREAAFLRRTTVISDDPDSDLTVEVSVTWRSPAGSGKVVTRGTCRSPLLRAGN